MKNKSIASENRVIRNIVTKNADFQVEQMSEQNKKKEKAMGKILRGLIKKVPNIKVSKGYLGEKPDGKKIGGRRNLYSIMKE
jgi:hypothetical protein